MKKALLREVGAPEELISELEQGRLVPFKKQLKRDGAVEEPGEAPAVTPEEKFVQDVRAQLPKDDDHQSRFDKMVGKNPKKIFESFGGDVHRAVKSVTDAVSRERAKTAKSKESMSQVRNWVAEKGALEDAHVRKILDDMDGQLKDAAAIPEPKKADAARQRAEEEAMRRIRSYVMTEKQAEELRKDYGAGHKVRKEILVVQEQVPAAGERPYESPTDFQERTKRAHLKGVQMLDTPDGPRVFVTVTDIDLLVTRDKAGAGGKDAIVRGEEVKTGLNDTNKGAKDQQDTAANAISKAAAGGARVKLLENGKDIAPEIDLATLQRGMLQTRGPDDKGFEKPLGITSADLETVSTELFGQAKSQPRTNTDPTAPDE